MLRVEIIEGSKSDKSIVAEAEGVNAILYPTYYGIEPSKLVIDDEIYEIAVIDNRAELRVNGVLVCTAIECRRPSSTRIITSEAVSPTQVPTPRKLEFRWDGHVIELRQFLDSYKILDETGKKIGKIRKKRFSKQLGYLELDRQLETPVITFLATLVGHLWKSDMQANKIKEKGGLSLLVEEGKETSWKELIFGGLLIIGFSIYGYYFFTELESSGKVEKVPWWIAFLYNLGGKFVVCGLGFLLGIGLIVSGFSKR